LNKYEDLDFIAFRDKNITKKDPPKESPNSCKEMALKA